MAEEAAKEAPKERVTVFAAGHCEPCEEIKGMLQNGQFLVNGQEAEVDLVDIETEEGFEEAQKHELTAVPSAFLRGKQCQIRLDEETKTVLIECDHVDKTATA